MEQKFTINGRLDGLNEYTLANRTNKFAGAGVKKRNENVVTWGIKFGKIKPVTSYPIKLKITWYEPNQKRDVDNVTFGVKFINDALVKYGILANDNQKCINAIEHTVLVDKENPRIEVTLIEN